MFCFRRVVPLLDALYSGELAFDLGQKVDSAESGLALFESMSFFAGEDVLFKQPLVRRLRIVVGAFIALAVGALPLGDEHLAWAEEVSEVRPHLAEFEEVLLQIWAVEPNLSEQLPARRPVFFFHMRIVVALPRARTPHKRSASHRPEERHHMMVQYLAAIVGMQ